MHPTVTLKNLRFFIAVAEEENFHRASEILAITQPALSRRIKDLETAVGADLFLRDKQRVRLTQAGAMFLPLARQMLRQVEESVYATQRFAAGAAGTLTLGLSDYSSRNGAVRKAFRSFVGDTPSVTLDIRNFKAGSPYVKRVADGELDAAFIGYGSPENITLEYLDIAETRLLAALPLTHRLASKSELRLADLEGEDVLWMDADTGPEFTNALQRRFHNAGVDVRLRPFATSEDVRVHLVSAGFGITLVTSSWVNYLSDTVALRPIQDLDYRHHLIFAWRKDNTNPALARFLARLSSAVTAEAQADVELNRQQANVSLFRRTDQARSKIAAIP